MMKKYNDQFVKGLETLKTEINAFKNEAKIWTVQGNISNSAGNLALHLIGNLNHFIGATLGETGYVRTREKEFTDKNISVTEIVKNIDATIQMLNTTFEKLPGSILQNTFPLTTFGENKTVEEALLILLAHLNYHLGQINYFRRLI